VERLYRGGQGLISSCGVIEKEEGIIEENM
jgi:hypothetical protein